MTNEIFRAKQMEVFIFYSQDKNKVIETKKYKKRMKFLKIINLINKNRLQIAARTK